MYCGVILVSTLVLIASIPRGSGQKPNTNSQHTAPFIIPPELEVVSSEVTPTSIGAIDRCGQGAFRKSRCVVYHTCPKRKKNIDISTGEGKRCDQPLHVCCEIPEIPEKPEIPEISTGKCQCILHSCPQDPYARVQPLPTQLPTQPSIFLASPPTTQQGFNWMWQLPALPSYSQSSPPITQQGSDWICGVRNDNGVDFKITGNKDHEAEYGEFPWMVAIVKTNYQPPNDSLLICGGSLISPSVVLTAAHCVNSINTKDMKVRLGEWDTQTENERLPYQERNIQRVIVHEAFKPEVLFNDVALLILDKPLQRAEHIGTICLPGQGMVFNTKECIVTGWGKDKFGHEGNYHAILKKIELQTVPNDECQDRLRTTSLGRDFVLDKSVMCAGGQRGQDICSGVGGSPLVCPDPRQPQRYIQAGIVSWRIGCEDKTPTAYANVANQRDWIEQQLRSFRGNKH